MVLLLTHMLKMCNTAAMRSYQSHDARLKMRDILSAVERGEHVEIKRYDTPTAIVVSPEWYERAVAALGSGEQQ
jgi:antitoxin (DNA-binding transcriptional repressor) of toxin-antitoxin stability system